VEDAVEEEHLEDPEDGERPDIRAPHDRGVDDVGEVVRVDDVASVGRTDQGEGGAQ
jgi:hypothetical protein